MRTFRILAALMMAVVCVCLSSCSDDENDKPMIEEANLIGKWHLLGRRFTKLRMVKK